MRQTNLHRIALEELAAHPAAFRAREADLTSAVGGEHLAAGLLELPPGQRAWPYHWESAQEEWVIVLSGRPLLRTPAGEEELAPGDVVCFPPGPDGAHQLRGSAEPCRVIMLSDVARTNVIVYPDSDKVAADTPWWGGTFRAGAGADYWEGE